MNLIQTLQENLDRIILPDSKTLYVLKGFSTVNLDPKIPKLGNLNITNLGECLNKRPNLTNLSGAYTLSYEEAGLASELTNAIQFLGYDVVIVNCNLYENIYPAAKDLITTESADAFYSDKEHCFQEIFSSIEKLNDRWYVTYNPLSFDSSLRVINLLDLQDAQEFPVLPNRLEEESSLLISATNASFASFIDQIIDNPDQYISAETQSKLPETVLKRLGFLHQFSHFNVQLSLTVDSSAKKIISNPEFLNILKRRNENFKFRDFKCYKDPNSSNETWDVNQETVINTIVENVENARHGKSFRDIFVTAPTGAGKSIMFQIPAIYLGEKYSDFLTIVISPLIGLMNDQITGIEDLTNFAATINSDYTPEMRMETLNKIRSGEVKILYISPESFIMNSDIAAIIGDKKIGLLVIDEAHTVVTWGQSFRPNYWYLGEKINQLRKLGTMSFPIATFSATVPRGDIDNMYQDIIDILNLDTYGTEFVGKVRRDEISFNIKRHKSNSDYEQEKKDKAFQSLLNLTNASTKVIAYFPYVRTLQEMFNNLNSAAPNKAVMYYGGMPALAKNRAAEEFRTGDKNVIFATKAFGMGIDVPDVDCVYHFAPTGILSDYVQEIGRAARKEGSIGIAETDYYENDFRYMKQLYGMSRIREYHIKGVLKKIYDYYMKHRKRNFTLSPDVFAHVFAKKDIADVDSSLKTTLLMIDKDFEMGNFSFKPLIFRPKSFFTIGYVIVDDSDIEELKASKYFQYFSIFRTKTELGYKVRNGECLYVGDMYKVNFKCMWEDNYQNISFADFKRRFYVGELENFSFSAKYFPNYLLNVEWKFDSGTLLSETIENYLNVLMKTFLSLGKDNKYFSASEFERRLLEQAKTDGVKFDQSLNFEGVLRKFATIINSSPSRGSYTAMVIIERNESFYIKLPTKIRRFFEWLAKSFRNDYFYSIGNRKSFVINSKHNNDLVVTNHHFIGAQILEILGLAEYSILSGERPEFFFRVNSIDAIRTIVFDENYKSQMVSIISKRHEEGVKIMHYFFENIETDKERWDYIEKYFNGLLKQSDYSTE